jgi:hypothetical protein
MSESRDQAGHPATRLRELLVLLKEAENELRLALDSEATMKQLLADARQAVRDQDVSEVRLLETPKYQEMVKKYEWHQAVMKNIYGWTEEADFQLQLLALESPAVGELVKPLHQTRTNPRDPRQLTFSIRLIERALSRYEEHQAGRTNPKRRRGNPDTDRILKRVRDLYNEATREGERPTSAEICERLDAKDIPLPKSTVWGSKCRTWREAFRTNRGALSTWLSRAKPSSK